MAELPQKISTAEEDKSAEGFSPFRRDILAKGIVTGVVVSTINQTGRSIMSSVAKHPLAMFGLGFVAGCFTYKYRKEIITAAGKTAEESKSFVLRQKENLLDLVAESRESAEKD